MQTLRAGPLVALALAVAVIVVQARIVAGAQTWDDVRYHTEIAPPRLAAGDAVRAGELPAWWDGTSFGVPLAAEPSHGAMYPLVWLATSPRVLDWILLLHAWWLALGVAVWARRRGASEYGALGAGIAIAASGIVASCAMRGALLGLAHVPWIGLLALQLRTAEQTKPRLGAAALLALALGACGIAGELGIFVDAIVLAIAIGASRRTLPHLAGAAIGGLAIASAQWLPALHAIATGAGASVRGIPVARLLELLVPGCFGGDGDRALAAIAGHAPWAPSVFVGAALFALALVRVPGRRFALALVLPVAAAAIVGRGGWPSWAGAPETHVAVLAVLVAVLAAAGLDALFARDRAAVIAVAAAAVVTAIALGAVGALGGAPQRVLIDGSFGVLCLGAAAAIAWRIGIVEATAGKRRRPPREDRRALTGAPLLGVLALVIAPNVGSLGSTTPTVDRVIVEDPPLWAADAANIPAPRRLYRPASLAGMPDELADQLATLAGTYGARWGITSVRSDDPARSPLDDKLWLASAHQGGALLARFGVALAILPAGATVGLVDPTGRTAGAAKELGRRTGWALLAYPTTAPASVIEGWRFEPDPARALALLFPPGERNGLDRGEVVLAGTGAPSQDIAEPVPCTIDSWDDGAIDLGCTARAESYAIVSSSAAEGWDVAVDGQPAHWLAADVVRRAVALGPGVHRVAWRYHAPGLAAGLVAAALAILAALGVLIGSRR